MHMHVYEHDTVLVTVCARGYMRLSVMRADAIDMV